MCGVFGAFCKNGSSVLEDVYLGLYALQHRGQESAGIAWNSENGDEVNSIKGMGLVHIALDQKQLASISASSAIGHVRYSTTGSSGLANAHPITANYSMGSVAIAHNGNITNATGIRNMLESRGAIFQSTTDTETIIHLMAHQSHKPPLDALVDALRRLKGAYSLAVLLGNRLVAARDPWGFRPLVLGRREDTTYVASESCALDIVGATLVRDVEPGEMVVIDETGIKSLRIPVQASRKYSCAFEYVYFARPDSVIDGKSVYEVRKALGCRLAKSSPCPSAEIVTGMPDSGTIAAMGFAECSKQSYETAIVRNRYIGRTFIQPTQRVRTLGVRIKLNPIKTLIDGRELAVVDDSIVRGTTVKRVISMIRQEGAARVHIRIASPPVRFPCYYGIDTPTCEELAAARLDIDTLRSEVGADSLNYLGIGDLLSAIGLPSSDICTACFSGEYLDGGEDNGMDL
ncbi:MAG TPA: amidophosphoribosyltransferase [Thermovirgaceae bacterium]|jgi:amidophosphoribosyltransferase|nr:amidophosphoribosyltransferase [Synergistales bacterium]MDY0179069.1 amidophosphoribosyltransferase [Synergistaceae bacterium]HRW88233.1 amidophosphoribosyltransferase [Thermovirgaceae bacterium]MDD3134020.1 amidophosphoribosyltransferase [Synergistales bacterium]MDD3829537.1 amidophosphoribosyltransferase [Synergistales bacterium]